MTSQLNVDTIVDKAGSGGSNVKMANTSTYVSDGGNVTQNTVQGLAKTWMNYKGTSTNEVRDSLNISGVVDNGTGSYTPSYSNSFSSINYSASGGAGSSDTKPVVRLNTPLAGNQPLETRASTTGSNYDEATTRFTAHGDLA